MFKPSLKRSRQSPHAALGQPVLPRTTATATVPAAELQIPELFHKPIAPPPLAHAQKIITPLNCWNLEYPAEVKQRLLQPIHQVRSRAVGAGFGIYWLITDNVLYLWRYDSFESPNRLKMQRKFEFEKDIRTVAIGHMDRNKCGLLNMKQDHQTLAIGFESIIDLYTIDLGSLEIRSMEIKLKVEFKQAVDKIVFTTRNQLLFTGDQGFLTRVDFNGNDFWGSAKIMKQNAKPPTFRPKNLISSLGVSTTQPKIYTEKILASSAGKVYLLIKKETQKSLLERFTSSALKFLSGRIKEDETWGRTEKQIHIYKVTDGKWSKLQFQGILTNWEIEQKLRQSYLAHQSANKLIAVSAPHEKKNSIASIFLTKSGTPEEGNYLQKLSFMTVYGLSLTIREDISHEYQNFKFSFDDEPQRLPDQLYQSNKNQWSTALFLRRRKSAAVTNPEPQPNQFKPLSERGCNVVCSFGFNNLNFLSDGLCFYFDNRQVQVAKLDKQPGLIMESTLYTPRNKLHVPVWLVFSKTEVTLIKKSQVDECLLASVSAVLDISKQPNNSVDKIQDAQVYANEMMEEIGQVVGKDRLVTGLAGLFLKIYKSRADSPILNALGEVGLNVNIEFKEMAKEETSAKIRMAKRLKSLYQPNRNDRNISVFSRWLLPKRKQIKQEFISISPELEEMLWRLFLTQSLGSTSQYSNLSDNPRGLSVLSNFYVSYFQQNYKQLKNMSLTELRLSPIKIKQIKLSLLALQKFLQDKKSKSASILHRILYMKKPIREDTEPIKVDQNITQDSLNASTLDTKDSIMPQKEWAANNVSAPLDLLTSYRHCQNQVEQVETQLAKSIDKLIQVLSIYETLAANSQGKYEGVPSIDKFMQSLSAKKEVKLALLDLFSSKDISAEPTILKYSSSLPELRLQSDIYLSRWLKFIHRAEGANQPEKPNLAVQVRLSDLSELSWSIEMEHIVKIKQFFKDDSSLYVKLLISQLEMRKHQYEDMRTVIKSEASHLQPKGPRDVMAQGGSLFSADKLKTSIQWKEWLFSEITQIRNEISRFIKELAMETSKSSPQTYLSLDTQLDLAVKELSAYHDGDSFIQGLIAFLRENSMMPEKIYQLNLHLAKRNKKNLSSVSAASFKPELMSTYELLRSSARRNRDEILGSLNLSFSEQGSLQREDKPSTLAETTGIL